MAVILSGEWHVPCPTHQPGSCETKSGVSTRITFDPALNISTPNVSLGFAQCTDRHGQWITGPCPCCGDELHLSASNVSKTGATITLRRTGEPSFGSSFIVSWQAPAPPPPPPPPPAAPHLSIMTFYGFNQSAQCGWSNVMWQELRSGPGDQPFKKNLSVALQELVSYREHCNGTGFIMLPVHFFAAGGHGLPPGWQTALTAFEDTIEPYVQNKTCIGIFMGDEKLCDGVPLSNYTAVLSHLRQRYPDLLLYGNECSNTVGRLGAIPGELDLFSFDLYDALNEDGLSEVEQQQRLAEQVIFPKLHPHQRLLLVPGIYANTVSKCEANGGGDACPLDSQARQISLKLSAYFDWARSDTRIVGFNPWHFNVRGPQNGPAHDMALGAVVMPSVVDKLREIGEYVVKHGVPPKRQKSVVLT